MTFSFLFTGLHCEFMSLGENPMKQNNSYSCVIDDVDMANVANANVIEVSTEIFLRSFLGL